MSNPQRGIPGAILICILVGLIVRGSAQTTKVIYDVERVTPNPAHLGQIIFETNGHAWRHSAQLGRLKETAIYCGNITLEAQGQGSSAAFDLRSGPSTGRIQFIPALPKDISGFDLFTAKGDRMLSMDAVVSGDHLLYEPVRHNTESGHLTSAEVSYNGRLEIRWRYDDYRKAFGLSVPGTIERARFKDSGLNIPHDDVIRWRLAGASQTADAIDFEHIPSGVTVIDHRQEPVRSFIFEQGAGSLLKQSASGIPLPIPDQAGWFPSAATPIALLLASVVGFLAIRRLRRNDIKPSGDATP